MTKRLQLPLVVLMATLGFAGAACAQDLVITNGRILDGKGGIIDNGTVVIRGGKIESIVTGKQTVNGMKTIDAGGKTVMPGFVEGHRHLITGNPGTWLAERAPAQMQDFLEAGFTTVLDALDTQPALAVRDKINKGEMAGPRVFVAAFIPVAGPVPGAAPAAPGDPARTDPARIGGGDKAASAISRDETIKQVQTAKKAGYDYLKCVVNTTPNGPEIDTLKLIVAEGKKIGMPTIVHAVSVKDTLAVIDAQPALLVHTPHIGRLDTDPAAIKKIIGAGIPMTSTLAVFIPHFDDKNTPLFRDAQPFPWDTLSSGGQGPVNARLLWQAGITYGYGTDTQWPARQSLNDELRALALVFSPSEIVKILTNNAAIATMHSDQFGSLQAGKFGDVVIVDGDPLTDTSALLHVVTTIKEGKVVFQK
ncbi:MAG TPA: amidohydrolase family protein [Candidatus Acidoferrum sp.]|nr:amidohydrolase family protein [Candidatus Acidoferrum sp.]